ncbi:zinc finger protein 91-like isoform X2 [Cottoperca gobio]|nr:zinc finger protein 91-like isoform X2 [Cottoperca gobio]
MNQPEPLHTLIQHHKQHGHKVPQASSSSGDDCILSSLSYHLPNVDIEERGALKDEGGALKDEKENFKETNSKLKRDVERDARQHVDDLTEDQGASVEVILQPSDESESNDNDDVGKKGFRHLKTASSTSSKTFNCLVCGQDFDSPSKLKKHQITQSGCCSKTVGPSNSADQNRFLEKLNLHPKPKTCVENKTSTSENKLSSTLDPSNLNSLANFEQSNDDDARLVCHVCDKVFTYPKSFDRHQRNCVVSRKRQAETDTQCSTSLPRPSKANPVVKTKDSSPSETEAGLSNVVPHESTSSDSKMKRSSRVKQCSVCGKTFTWCADLTRHMRSHTELKDDKENFKETNSKLKRDVERDARQHVDDLTEDQGASVEVILQPSDESESNDNDDVGKKGFRHLKTASSTSSKTFNCLVCGQDFDSPSKLKKHQITQSGCCSKTVGPSNSADQNRFLENLNLHPKPKTCVENKTSTSENELSSTRDPSNLNSLANFEQSNDDDARLVCHVCDKVFTYPKSFDRHQRNCVVSRKRQAETDMQCSTSLPRPSKANPVVKTKDSSPSETEAGLSNVVPHESTSSDSKMKRSSRVKQCSVCGKTFTWCADLTRHMRSHTEQYSCAHCGKDFDSYEDCESHQEEKCRVSNQCSQDNSASNANIRNQENIVASSSITQIPSISNASANSQAKSPLTCQECGQGFTYSKSFEKHKSKCSQRAPKKRKERANENNFVINARHLRSAENTNAKASSEIKESESAKSPTSADNADGPQTKSRSIKCTLCENKFSEIVLMKRHYFTSHKVRTGSTSANQKLVPVLCLQQLLHKASSTK